MKKLPLLTAAAIALSTFSGSVLAQTTQQGTASGNAKPAASQSGGTGKNAVVTVPVPLIVLVPLEFRADPNFAQGCWVRLYNGMNFKGNDELTIVGPTDMQTMKTPSGVNWKRKAESLEVGPKATVTVYENEFFKDKTVTYQPGQKVDNLRKSLGIFHAIDSLKVACTPK